MIIDAEDKEKAYQGTDFFNGDSAYYPTRNNNCSMNEDKGEL